MAAIYNRRQYRQLLNNILDNIRVVIARCKANFRQTHQDIQPFLDKREQILDLPMSREQFLRYNSKYNLIDIPLINEYFGQLYRDLLNYGRLTLRNLYTIVTSIRSSRHIVQRLDPTIIVSIFRRYCYEDNSDFIVLFDFITSYMDETIELHIYSLYQRWCVAIITIWLNGLCYNNPFVINIQDHLSEDEANINFTNILTILDDRYANYDVFNIIYNDYSPLFQCRYNIIIEPTTADLDDISFTIKFLDQNEEEISIWIRIESENNEMLHCSILINDNIFIHNLLLRVNYANFNNFLITYHNSYHELLEINNLLHRYSQQLSEIFPYLNDGYIEKQNSLLKQTALNRYIIYRDPSEDKVNDGEPSTKRSRT